MNDLISRQAAILELRIWWDDPEDNRSTSQVMDSLPTIDTVKHGKWIGGSGDYGRKWFRCSSCDEAMVIPTQMGNPTFDYCPNCGARMDNDWEEPEINPCRGCDDYDWHGGCKSHGGCGADRSEE